ncbi:Panacea domain-containing protein [Bdellovibrionota bacterium FG-2]
MDKIKFEVNPAKALESFLYVLSKKPGANLYNVLKSLFAADKDHLNRHGRPVTGDTYMRMELGTVPSFIYDLVKGELLALMELGTSDLPFERRGYDLSAKRPPNLSLLSKSDIQSLDLGIAEYLNLSFEQVKKKNHQERCWVETGMNQRIDFELMIDDENMLAEIRSIPLKQVI